jgi:hypothetical protein
MEERITGGRGERLEIGDGKLEVGKCRPILEVAYRVLLI